MTDYEKSQILLLMAEGMGYKKIATMLHLPPNGVKTFCRRQKEAATIPERTEGCLYCGAEIVRLPHTKVKKFCSDKCRMAWWNTHRDKGNKKAYYQQTCSWCGQRFESYGNKNRVYCSRECYNKARRKAVDENGRV